MLLWLLPGVRYVGGLALDIHTLVYASGLIMLGLQACLFSIFTKLFGINLKLLPPDRLFRRVVDAFSLERGLVFGLLLIAGGAVGSIYAVVNWKGEAFGPAATAGADAHRRALADVHPGRHGDRVRFVLRQHPAAQALPIGACGEHGLIGGLRACRLPARRRSDASGNATELRTHVNAIIPTGSPASWRTHAAFMLASSVACLIWSWAAGKDLNWDQLNYHFYSAYHYLDDRLEQDFMGASIQGYLNPLGYVPFYLMVRANWPSLLIGSVLALIHSTCLWLIYGISRELIPADTRFRTALIAAAVALAFLAPIYLIEVGSTFIDVTTTVPVLAGILLLLICDRSRHGGWLVLLAGLLMGATSGLKLTNAMFAVAASAFIVLASRPVKVRIRDLGLYVAGGCIGLLLVGGAWAYRLFKAFGNPLFPLFSAWFQSPDLPAFEPPFQNYRFLPETLLDYLLFPIRMLSLRDYVYTETMSSDVRFFALAVLLAALGVALLIRRRKPMAATAGGPGTSTGHRMYAAALVFTLASYVLWLHSSGNGRYAIALELFIGPMIVASAIVFSRSQRTRVYLMGSILLAQATVVYIGADRRWQPADWTAKWYEVTRPAAAAAA